MAAVTGASLPPILHRLNSVEPFHPLRADTFGDWSLEAGDIVTVTRDNQSFTSPVHSSTLIWKKKPQLTISTTGEESREVISKASQRKFSGGGSGGLRNAENAYYAIETSYNGMRSGLILASSSASLYVEDMYNNMKSGLDLTSSSAALYVDDRYKQMKSGLDLTSSSAHLYVDNKYTQMKSGLQLTSSSAAIYASSATNAAKIVARINESSGQSEIEINADKIYQLGQTIANTITADYINTKVETLATLNAKNISCNSITAGTNIYGPNGLSLYTNGLWNVTLSGPTNNVYTLKQTTLNGTQTTIGTFSRATALTGEWSSGNYTVTASPQGETISTGGLTVASGQAWRDGDWLYVPIYAGTTPTGYNAWIGWKNLLTAHSNSTGDLHRYNTVTKTTMYIKIGDTYSSAGQHFWYYKDTDSSLTTYYN